jgi:hypothetical protein
MGFPRSGAFSHRRVRKQAERAASVPTFAAKGGPGGEDERGLARMARTVCFLSLILFSIVLKKGNQ